MTEISVRKGVARVGNIEIAYEDWGDVSARPMILIMGLIGQMVTWPDQFCERLVARGHRVIRFDNRDIGFSTRIAVNDPQPGTAGLLFRSTLGLKTRTPYSLEDMAGDVIGLMDALAIDRADIVGMSMAGMIAQIVAGKFPGRVASLGVLMSTTNQAFLPPPAMPTFRAMLDVARWPVRKGTPSDYFKDTLRFLSSIRSKGYGIAERDVEDGLRAMFGRSANEPAAVRRQFLAALGAGDLRRFTRAIQAPALVIHGAADPVFRPAAGRAVAKTIRKAEFQLIPGMGHDLPEPVWDRITESLSANSRRSKVLSVEPMVAAA